MFRTVGPQGSLFELLLPPGMRVLCGELAEIDLVLDDDRFFSPFRSFSIRPRGARRARWRRICASGAECV